jgi:hypothetical protein
MSQADIDRMTYHAWRISLANLTITDVVQMSEGETPGNDDLKTHALSRVRSSAKAIADHSERFRAAFGRKHFSIYMTQASMTVIWSVMDALQDPEVQGIFHSLLVTISVTARRALIVRGFSRVILGTLRERGQEKHLSEASKTLLQLNAVDTWAPGDHELFKSVTYPNVVVAREEGRVLADMGDLLQKWETLEL